MGDSAHKQDPRRRFPRFDVENLQAAFRAMGDMAVWKTGKVVNLSKGGMCLETNEPIAVGEILEVMIQKQSQKGKPFIITATVVWKAKNQFGLSFLA